ncbi:hypothetical protein CRE_28142 [Caenorhabditis remanei]|uniref:Uncharacterized protein n=1 Tax=Caenorhabditis remanei TaxID=31234 RepID=E3LMJ4_CAERE|nr:hypothetical protein CRE_28142 [Caenorhabditis remanei]
MVFFTKIERFLNVFLLFLICFRPGFSLEHIRNLKVEFSFDCLDNRSVCVFIEVFEDEVIYEQLLTRYDSCLTNIRREAFRESTFFKHYGFFSNRNIPINVTLEPIHVGPIKEGKLDAFTANFQITNDCGKNREIMCYQEAIYYDGIDTLLSLNRDLNHTSKPGPCSNRWLGSQLWLKNNERREKDRQKDSQKPEESTTLSHGNTTQIDLNTI